MNEDGTGGGRGMSHGMYSGGGYSRGGHQGNYHPGYRGGHQGGGGGGHQGSGGPQNSANSSAHGANAEGANVPTVVHRPPPPEFEMKGNDFPALPGLGPVKAGGGNAAVSTNTSAGHQKSSVAESSQNAGSGAPSQTSAGNDNGASSSSTGTIQ